MLSERWVLQLVGLCPFRGTKGFERDLEVGQTLKRMYRYRKDIIGWISPYLSGLQSLRRRSGSARGAALPPNRPRCCFLPLNGGEVVASAANKAFLIRFSWPSWSSSCFSATNPIRAPDS